MFDANRDGDYRGVQVVVSDGKNIVRLTTVSLTVDGAQAVRQKASQSGVDVFLVKGVSVETLVEAASERRNAL